MGGGSNLTLVRPPGSSSRERRCCCMLRERRLRERRRLCLTRLVDRDLEVCVGNLHLAASVPRRAAREARRAAETALIGPAARPGARRRLQRATGSSEASNRVTERRCAGRRTGPGRPIPHARSRDGGAATHGLHCGGSWTCSRAWRPASAAVRPCAGRGPTSSYISSSLDGADQPSRGGAKPAEPRVHDPRPARRSATSRRGTERWPLQETGSCSVLAPLDAVLLTRRHIQEVDDGGVSRGHMNHSDAQETAQSLLSRSARATDIFLSGRRADAGQGAADWSRPGSERGLPSPAMTICRPRR